MQKFKPLFIFFLFLSLAGCEKIAILTTPKKQPIASHGELATLAQNKFWNTLHAGQYDQIPETTRLLTAAYLQNPNDPELASHLGFIHIWKITEREREKTVEPTITNEIILARKYFSDAAELNPGDARVQGFLGDSILIEGKIFHDEREEVHGYFKLKHAISMWPEFNYFTAGYPMSILNPRSDQYKEALDWQWRTLDLCAGTRVNRSNPDFSPYMHFQTAQGPKRACWDSWIAPHNFEGFFLNMGDMLVKAGDPATAVRIYNNAKLAPNYATWPYRLLLEDRIAHAQENVSNFQKNQFISAEKAILFNSGYGCAVCHQIK